MMKDYNQRRAQAKKQKSLSSMHKDGTIVSGHGQIYRYKEPSLDQLIKARQAAEDRRKRQLIKTIVAGVTLLAIALGIVFGIVYFY